MLNDIIYFQDSWIDELIRLYKIGHYEEAYMRIKKDTIHTYFVFGRGIDHSDIEYVHDLDGNLIKKS